MKTISNPLPGVTLRSFATLRNPRRQRAVRPADLRWEASDESAPARWTTGRARFAEVQLWSRETGAERVELTAGVKGREDWSIQDWTWQVRVACTLRARFTWPLAAGAIVTLRELLEAERTLELTYPVYASMQWVDVFGPRRSTYIAAHDAAPYFKHLRVHAEREGGKPVLVFEFIYTDLIWPPHREWTSPPLVIAKHTGDWREGARIYRAWANSWFRREPVPEYLQRTPGHNMISFPTDGGRIRFDQLPELAKRSRRLGLDGVHVADWMHPAFDTHYPAYQVDDSLGGEKALKRAIRAMREQGSYTCMYLNGRLNDPAGPHGDHAFDWAVKLPPPVQKRFAEMWKRTQDPARGGWDPLRAMRFEPEPFNVDGTAAQEDWGRILAPMCPSVPAWRELWLSRMTDVATRYRPRMLQVDQVCGCWGLPCYDENHPHRSPALAWSDYKAFTWAMRHTAHRVDPEIALWSEGVNDMLGQAFDGLQAILSFDALLAGLGEWDPRIFKLTFPEYVLFTCDLTGREPNYLLWAIITGGHYHFFIPDTGKLDDEAARWVRFAAKVRRQFWRAFSSHDVFVPDVKGDSGVAVLGYRHGKTTLLAGGPVTPSERSCRAFDVEVAYDRPHSLRKSEWLVDEADHRVQLTRTGCRIRGEGPFALLLQQT